MRRYNPEPYSDGGAYEDPDGKFVSYEDVEVAIAVLRRISRQLCNRDGTTGECAACLAHKTLQELEIADE